MAASIQGPSHISLVRALALAASLAAGLAQAGPATFSQLGINFAIPDGNVAGVNITLNVSGLGSASILTEASVGVTHTWLGDLTYTLSHGGASVTLMDREGSRINVSTNLNLVLIDGAAIGAAGRRQSARSSR